MYCIIAIDAGLVQGDGHPGNWGIQHLTAASMRRLPQVAEIARRPVDDVIAQLVDSGLPPLLDAVPDALRECRARADQLMFEKAYAAILLRWRGEHEPSLADLEAAV